MRNPSIKILTIFGTRPEAIKMAPLVIASKGYSNLFDLKVCVTAQHRQMLDQALTFFDIIVDYDLDLMKPDQSLFELTTNCLKGLDKVFESYNPDLVFVQGDTTTAFIGALAAFYKKTPVAHVEAGLRSRSKYSPFPEEMNRILIDHIADYHFAPTERAVRNLNDEGLNKNIWLVGNTIVDALLSGLEIIRNHDETVYRRQFHFIDFSKRIVLVTGHRRESFGTPFENICNALWELVNAYEDIEIVYPVHLNPSVQEPVYRILNHHGRIHLIDPVEYPHLIWLMDKSHIILTDSGGIQEEAPSMGKPVLVMRGVTERTEGIEAGTAKLVKTDKDTIVEETSKLLDNESKYRKMSNASNPYGDGKSANRIFNILSKVFFKKV